MTDQRKLSPGAQFIEDMLAARARAKEGGLSDKRIADLAGDFAEDMDELVEEPAADAMDAMFDKIAQAESGDAPPWDKPFPGEYQKVKNLPTPEKPHTVRMDDTMSFGSALRTARALGAVCFYWRGTENMTAPADERG